MVGSERRMKIPARRRVPAASITAILVPTVVLLGACSDDGRELRPPRPEQNESIITTTSAPDTGPSFDVASLPALESGQLDISVPWSEGGAIPTRFTCTGENISPDVAWFDVSPAAVSMAIVLYEDNLDQTVHWVVANLDPTQAYIDAGKVPPDALVGTNDPVSDESSAGYRGPCPEPGTTRSYTIEVHALGQFLDLPTGTPAQSLIQAIDMASLQTTSVTGTVTG